MIETIIWDRIRLIGERRLFFLLIIFLGIHYSGNAQMGCLDPQATNYDAQATISDGSCDYPLTNLTANEIAELPAELNECSGFVRLADAFIGINDSGADAILTFLDTQNFQWQQEQELSEAENVDWEEITVDDSFLYIGDFGNNQGTRTDLKIYKLPLGTLQSDPELDAVISFNYEDQTSFQAAPFSTPFDCEAFVVKGDSIHLFSKGWSNGFTKHYWIPNEAGNHSAELIDSFDVNGLITGASLVGDSMMIMTGYGNGSFCWLLKDYSGSDFLSGNKRRLELGNLGQNETITWIEEGRALITNEAGFGTGKVFEIDFLDIITSAQENVFAEQIEYFPNPFSEYLYINLPTAVPGDFILYDALGNIRWQSNEAKSVNLMTEFLPAGNYFLQVKLANNQFVFPLVKLADYK